ncbi:MAG: hypothetical protein JWR42_245 [Marmoricola sp.]|nr:hypothetical protein [Marmoricola sp.]
MGGGRTDGGAVSHAQWRPDWTTERPCFYWYLTFGLAGLGLDEVAVPLDRCPWLDPVPDDWQHLTLCDVGFADEMAPHDLDRLAQAVGERVRTITPFGLELGPVGMVRSALVLEAGPPEALTPLRELVLSTTREVLGPDSRLFHEQAFVPHVSLGYVNRQVPGLEVEGFLATLPDLRRRLAVERVELVCVTREERHYRWWTRAAIPLGGAPDRRPAPRVD